MDPESYFRARAPREEVVGDYWGNVADPDGRVRDLMSVDEMAISARDAENEIRYVAASPGEWVIDLGCGPGASSLMLHMVGGKRVACVDPDARALGHARRMFESRAREGSAVFYPDVRDLPSDTRASGLLCYHAIEHMMNPVGTMRAAIARLAPGAHVAIGTPDFGSRGAREYGERYRLLHDPTHISLFDTGGLIRMLDHLGVSIDHVAYPFRGTRWEQDAAAWKDTGDNYSPPMLGNIVSVYGWKR